MINLGGYDINNFYDSNGVAFLTYFLQQQINIKVLIQSDDKIPNLDGRIELLKNDEKGTKKIPVRIFHVQVKTLNCKYYNENKIKNKSKYKYSIDTKILNVVKEDITSDPVLLFLVDTNNKKVFWFHISKEKVMSIEITEEENKTIYFGDEDHISDLNDFYEQLMKIHQKHILRSRNPMENILTTNIKKDSKIIDKLHEEWEYLDNVLCNKLKLMTKIMFPDTWKYGIAYETDDKFNLIGIYRIKEKDDNTFVKDFCIGSKDCFTISQYKKDFTDIREVLNRQISNMIKIFYQEYRLPAYCLSDIVLEEIMFYFLDQIAYFHDDYESKTFETVYYKNTEDVSEIKKIWNALILYEIESKNFIYNEYVNKENIEIVADPIGELKHDKLYKEKNKYDIFIKSLINEEKNILSLPYPFKFKAHQKYELYFDVLCELEKRQIKKINRPWKCKKYRQMFEQYRKLQLKGLGIKETGYLIEDCYFNFENILKNIPDAYKLTCQRLWGIDFRERCLKEESSISFDKEDSLFRYTKITRCSYGYDIIIDDYPEIQIDSKVHENIKSIHAQGITQGSFDSFIGLDCPLYSEIWYLINKEMWNKCDNNIHLPSSINVI